MTDTTRDLLISLASHMAYMQGQLEARHELGDPEDYYWYRESVLLRQKVADHLAAETQQPSSSLTELRSSPPTVMEIIELSEEAEAAGLGQVDFARAVLVRWGNPAPQPPADGEVAELVRMLTGIAHWRRRGRPGECDPSPFDIRQADRLDRAAELLQRLSPPQPLANGEVGKPVAWMCPAEPYFDGNKWHDQWQVTLDQRLAEYWARPGKPTPLFTRAAELLERQAVVPVAVSERPWEREGWCDVEGRFWAEHISRSGVASWRCAVASDLGGWAVRCLPAHALPVPEVGE